jgi:hypothetical protein
MNRDGAKHHGIELKGDLAGLDILNPDFTSARHLDLGRQQIQCDRAPGDRVGKNAGQSKVGAGELDQLTPGADHEGGYCRRVSGEGTACG